MRIEMVLPALPTGGMETMVAALTRGLVHRGHEVGVTCLEALGPIAVELKNAGVRVALVPTPGLRTILRAPQLEESFKRIAPDVVHVHSGAWLKGARTAWRAGMGRIVHTMHGLLEDAPWYTPGLDHWAARSTHRIIAVSESLRQYLIRQARVPASVISVIPNGIETEVFGPGACRAGWRESWGIPQRALLVGNVARLDTVKNHAQLIEAFAILRRQAANAVLVIAGDGPLRRGLESQAARMGVADGVRFLGETRDVAALYRELDVCVLNSHAEGTSITLLEAMATGVCVVGTAVGGTPALLAEGRVGRLVPPGDPRALATAILELLRDEPARRRLAEAGRQEVLAKYSNETMVRRYEREYGQPEQPPARPSRSSGRRVTVGRP